MLSIALPIAAVIAARLALRGKPWHGAAVVSLGVLLFVPLWALLTGGVARFTSRVEDPVWWQTTGAVALLGLLTGVPAIRARLFGWRSWGRARSLAEGSESEGPHGEESGFAVWQHDLQSRVSTLQPDDWTATIESIVPSAAPTPEALYADPSALESRHSGPLAQASGALDEVLDSGLDASGWRALLGLKRDFGPSLGPVDRAALIAQAAGRDVTLGHAVGYLFCSGVDTLIEQLGTPEQRKRLLPLFGSADRSYTEIVAGSWSSLVENGPATATVVRSEHDAKGALALRVNAQLKDVIGADAASTVAVGVRTLDPEGLTGLARDSSGSIGMTCVLLVPEATLARLDGATVAERLSNHPLLGDVVAHEAVVEIDSIIGGHDGIGAAGAALERASCAQLVARASVTAGVEQHRLLVETSKSVLGNVMASEPIEAWDQADLGARTLLARSLADSAAALEANGGAVASEGRSLLSAVAELAQQEPVQDAADSSEPPQLWWAPGWFRESQEAARAHDVGAFDAAWTTGLRQLVTLGCQTLWAATKGVKFTRAQRDAAASRVVSTRAGAVQLLRAWSLIRAAELRSAGAMRATDATAQALSSCAWIDLSHSINDRQPIEEPLRRFAVETQLLFAVRDLEARVRALPHGWSRPLASLAVRSLQKDWGSGPDSRLAESVAASLISHPEVVKRLSRDVRLAGSEAALQHGARLAAASRVPIAAVRRAQSVNQLPAKDFGEVLDLAATRRIITAVDAVKIRSCMAAASELLSFSSGNSGPEPRRKTA